MGQQSGHDLLGHFEVGLDLCDAGIGLVRLGLGHRPGCVDLPRQGRAQVGILSQQVEQDGGAGARLADDEDGPLDRSRGELGVLLAPLRDTQPIVQRADDVHDGDLDAQVRQVGLVHQSIGEPGEAVAPTVGFPEVIASRRLARLSDEGVDVEPGGAHREDPLRTVTSTSGASGLSSHRSTTKPR